ncbi:uncharacterized protein LOC122251362 [Penaeus japonicus]|uniref:uncharacterized protein LOC122251362 n=1 Tax=Penaeus japonicus TaxID=27405 RepID=UPI001C70D33B|nr:uncharacterized protein LOC122251362 [Penaeus japonicus]
MAGISAVTKATSGRFNTDLTSLFGSKELAVAGKALLLVAVALLLYDLLVYLLAPTSSRKKLLLTPWLTKVFADSWEAQHHSGPYARSEDAVGSVLRALADTATKYESRWEKSRLP